MAFAVAFTKIDKISENKLAGNIEEFKKTLSENWDEFPPIITTSSINKTGREEILKTIFNATKKLIGDK